ncbi:DNA polymerase III subunit beta [Bradyrhizobium septentrionale]|uniref:DNA polymerase III subunit beta n=1 Tax=Bradyrhizobium septentrionale TaxID=1404411 RepID=UPI001596886E|nr:DNA polymerase III subunit beta [Bradyrhizobium septentrionale]UGY21838.1 DNA polymerase III subunit beta [Bradyrhizobium septentrionale]
MMKLVAQAGALANATALASSALRTGDRQPMIIDASDGMISCTCPSKDIGIIAKAVADVAAPGRIAVAANRLSALAASFAPTAEVTITTTDTAMMIACGNSRSRLASIPATALPTMLRIDAETGCVNLSAADMARLLEPLAAAGADKSRYYLCGVCLQSIDNDLVTTGADGVRLLRVAVKAAPFSTDRTLIVPSESVRLIARLIARTKAEHATLRRSKYLFSVDAPEFQLTTRLIDHQFPDCSPLIPKASASAVTCSRADLLLSLHRLSAVAGSEAPLAALQWREGEPLRLYLAREPDNTDTIDAEATGGVQIALALSPLISMIEAFACERLQLETDADGPLKIIGEDMLGLLARNAWSFRP